MATVLYDTAEIKETVDYLIKLINFPGTAFVFTFTLVLCQCPLSKENKEKCIKGNVLVLKL